MNPGLKPGLDLVLLVLRDQTPILPPTHAQWSQALAAAEAEHILPYFVSRLRHSGLPLPPELPALLTAAEREAAFQAFFWSSELRGLLQAFTAATLPVLPLKGPALALRLYGGVALRTCRDLDLLVQPPDFPRASELLLSLGFTPTARPDDYHQPFLRNTTLVELHFDVENPLAFNFDTAAAWARAESATFLGHPILQLSPTDELLYLALHGVRHRFARLSYIQDAAQALHAFTPTLGPSLTLAGKASNLAPLAYLAQLLTLNLTHPYPLQIPVPDRTAAHMHALARSLWSSLLTEPERALDWQQQHRFYLDLQPNPALRLLHAAAHLRILTTRLIDSDYTHAARYGIRHPALVWLLRQLRLLTRQITPTPGS